MKVKVFVVYLNGKTARIAAEKMADAKRQALNLYGIPATTSILRRIKAREATIDDIKTD